MSQVAKRVMVGGFLGDVILHFPSHILLCLAPRTPEPLKLVLHP